MSDQSSILTPLPFALFSPTSYTLEKQAGSLAASTLNPEAFVLKTSQRIFLIAILFPFAQVFAQSNGSASWTFAVSGDSRNCGDVIMPAIAEGAKKHEAAFYWHLGDLRATAFIDEDYLHEPEHKQAPDKSYYNKTEWDDFIQSQLNPFGAMPLYVGIGNHEIYAPLSREQFIIKF